MTEPVRTAMIGTSWWADGAHLPGLRARPDVALAALCGRRPERLAELAAKYAVPRIFTDYETMLAEVQPELVVVATPNHEHAAMCRAALEAGAHVICEKPLALTGAEAETLLARAEALGRRHMTFFTYRGLAAARHVQRLVAGGYLGRLYHVQASYLHGTWLNPDRPASWKTSLAQGGSGVLGDLGAHVIDLLQWWFGPAERAAGGLSTFIAERPRGDGSRAAVETDDAAAFTLSFADGGQAGVQLSRLATGRHNYQRFECYGSAGMLVYKYDASLAHLGRVWGTQANDQDPVELPTPSDLAEGLRGADTFPALYRALTDPFFASLRGGPAAGPSFADGLAVQRVIDAVARSARGGGWETV